MTNLRHNQQGFTIIELMIATAVFATVLLVCSIGMLQIGRTYYKGITSSRTQEAARSVLEEISQAIQFGSGSPVTPAEAGPGLPGVYCAGSKRFSYLRDRQVTDSPGLPDQSRYALVVDEVNSCGGVVPQDLRGNPTLTDTSKELLGTRMRLATLTVTPITPVGFTETNLYRVTVRIVSGDADLLNAAHTECSTQRAGTQFCAASELSTVVQKRVR